MNRIPEAAAWLRSHDDVALLTHISPDGDALGSALCMLHALTRMGRRAVLVCQDPVPAYLQLLPGWERIAAPYPATELPFEPQCAFALDCADQRRTGTAQALLSLPTLCVDHHGTNPGYGEVCHVDATAAATGEILFDLLDALNCPVDGTLARCLYVAIATDTGNFSFSSTSERTFRCAARCMAAGLPLAEFNEKLFRTRTAAKTRLTGRVLDRIRYEDGIAILCITRQDFADCGATLADTENLVNYGIETEGVKAAVMAIEREGSTRFSLRSKGEPDVARIAASFGGGGHSCAAGATLNLPLPEAVEAMLQAVKKA